MILKTKQSWTVDTDGFEDIPNVMEEWFTITELRSIFEIKQKDYEKWNEEVQGLDDEDLEKPYWFLTYLIDNDGLMLERHSVIEKLLHYKKGYYDFSFSNEWDFYAVIREYDLSEFTLTTKQENEVQDG